MKTRKGEEYFDRWLNKIARPGGSLVGAKANTAWINWNQDAFKRVKLDGEELHLQAKSFEEPEKFLDCSLNLRMTFNL